jgi:hypothetical protein
MPPSFSQVHGRPVTLEMKIQGRPVSISGTGRYENHCLLVDVKDAAGDFSLSLNESKWDGEITHLPGNDSFTIRLDALPG